MEQDRYLTCFLRLRDNKGFVCLRCGSWKKDIYTADDHLNICIPLAEIYDSIILNNRKSKEDESYRHEC